MERERSNQNPAEGVIRESVKAVVPRSIHNVLSKEYMKLWITLCGKYYVIDSEPIMKTSRWDPTQIHDRRNTRYFGIPRFWMVCSGLLQVGHRIGRNKNLATPRTIPLSWITHEILDPTSQWHTSIQDDGVAYHITGHMHIFQQINIQGI